VKPCTNIATGRQLTAARILAGLSQTELASLAGIHRNSLQRLEGLDLLKDCSALEKIETALRTKGVTVSRWPSISITLEQASQVQKPKPIAIKAAQIVQDAQPPAPDIHDIAERIKWLREKRDHKSIA
jgi:transcriptional regulator with XRE-family HTH domain